MLDIYEEIPERKSSNAPQPRSSVRTRRMRQETAKRIEKDKIFTTYMRRSRRIRRNQTQDDQPESNTNAPMDIESSTNSQPEQEAEMGIESNMGKRKEPAPANNKQRRLEKQIEELKEELMEANMLEKVTKKENEMQRAQSKKIQQKNEKLKKQIKELKTEQTEMCKRATKWYTQKKSLKEKYKNMKHEFQFQKNAQVQKNIDVLL